MPEDLKTGFLKTLWILKDYLGEIVVGGGWVPLIYYHYLLGDKSKEPIRTFDLDLMVNANLSVIGPKTVDELLSEAGFKAVFRSKDTPPVIHYEGTVDGQEIEIEFLTDQKGPKEVAVIEVQKGLHAEALRFISISTENTIEVEVDDFSIGTKSSPFMIKVPSPGAFIFHKGLVFARRSNQVKGAKDLYYIFEVLANCTELRGRIIKELIELEKIYQPWFTRFSRNLENSFPNVASTGVNLVLSQRPVGVFPNLDDEQFKQYALGTFQELIGATNAIR